jgi:alpha-D-ribose 1-methylphosphonate 5-triphosphate synthase subunit PhnG
MRSHLKPETGARQRVMAILARSSRASIDTRIGDLTDIPAHEDLREPESGLVMLRGRIAGSGAPFNVGEASVTRAAVKLASGEIGASYILGRDVAKARSAALIDALWQSDDWRARIEADVIGPLSRALAETDGLAAAQAAATRVDFFTLVRGED